MHAYFGQMWATMVDEVKVLDLVEADGKFYAVCAHHQDSFDAIPLDELALQKLEEEFCNQDIRHQYLEVLHPEQSVRILGQYAWLPAVPDVTSVPAARDRSDGF